MGEASGTRRRLSHFGGEAVYLGISTLLEGDMRIFVAGATGVVGRRAVPALIAAGHQVTAIGRNPERSAALARAGATVARVDLFDRDAVRRAVAGHDVVINLATHIPQGALRLMLPGAFRENDRIRREGSAVLADAVLASGAGRF